MGSLSGSGEPRIIWVKALICPFIKNTDKGYIFSQCKKFNEILEEISQQFKHTHVMEAIIPDDDNTFDRMGNLTSVGKITLWREVNMQMHAFDKGKIDLRPWEEKDSKDCQKKTWTEEISAENPAKNVIKLDNPANRPFSNALKCTYHNHFIQQVQRYYNFSLISYSNLQLIFSSAIMYNRSMYNVHICSCFCQICWYVHNCIFIYSYLVIGNVTSTCYCCFFLWAIN